MRAHYLFLLLTLLIFSCKQKAQEQKTEIVAYECDFSDAIGLDENMECGYLEVPENHAKPEGRKIRIAYVVLKAKKPGQTPAYPMIYFSGGPGGLSIADQAIKGWAGTPINENRDIILFDQRGINYSTALPDIGPELFKVMEADADPDQEKAMFADVLDAFKQKCEEEGIDLGSYNSYENARDVGMLMTHLGHKKYNLLGGSYGTRLARIVQDMFPEKIHSVVLDAPAPMSTDFLISRMNSYSLALQRVFDFCGNDPQCSAQYPNLKDRYMAAIASLKNEPMEVLLDGEPFYVNAQDAMYFLRRRLYRADSRESAPAFIAALDNREGDAIGNDVNYEKNIMVPFINTSMLLAVEIHEQFNTKYTPQVVDSIYQTMELLPEKLGFFTALYETGQTWHNNKLSIGKRVFKPSGVPTLIFVNHYDPVTPPEYGVIFKEKLSNSALFVLDQGGHGSLNNACGIQVVMDFMDNPDPTSLNTSCLNLYKE